MGDVVSVTMDGHLVSWTNVYAGSAAPTNVPPVAAVPDMELSTPLASPTVIDMETQVPLISPNSSVGTQTQIPQSSHIFSINTDTQFLEPSSNSSISTETQILRTSPTSGTVATQGSDKAGVSWSRQAYYNAAGGVSEGFTFLNHFGGSSGIPGTADGGEAWVQCG